MGGSAGTGTTRTTGSSGGCNVAGASRKSARWGAALTLGAVVAAGFRRLFKDDDESS
jgi:MYXO-CTERM domain-containing protein